MTVLELKGGGERGGTAVKDLKLGLDWIRLETGFEGEWKFVCRWQQNMRFNYIDGFEMCGEWGEMESWCFVFIIRHTMICLLCWNLLVLPASFFYN